MKILKENAGQLTNFEVLDFLRSRGAAKDPTGVLAPIAPSEFKVYNYLEHTAAKTQTRETIAEFLSKCKQFKLTKSEIGNIINIRPSSDVQLFPLVGNCESRFKDDIVEEMVELIVQVFPPSEDESENKDESESKVESEPDDESNELKEITT